MENILNIRYCKGNKEKTVTLYQILERFKKGVLKILAEDNLRLQVDSINIMGIYGSELQSMMSNFEFNNQKGDGRIKYIKARYDYLDSDYGGEDRHKSYDHRHEKIYTNINIKYTHKYKLENVYEVNKKIQKFDQEFDKGIISHITKDNINNII